MRRIASLTLFFSFVFVVVFGGLRGNATSAMDIGADVAALPAQQNAGFELGGQIMTFLYPNEMRAAGMSWLKMQVVWNRGGSTADAQNVINHARRHGFKVLLSIKGNKAELAVNQQQYYQDYANFVAAVARLNPDAIEIWNEPNIDREWPAGLIHGGVYTQLLSRAYTAIKAANPNVMVISGAPAPTGYFGGGCATAGCDDKIFIEQMAAAGAPQYFDCVGMHYNEGVLPPSATSGDPRGSSGHYSRYYSSMVNTYRTVFPSKPLCFTELGYLTPEGLGSLPAGFEWGANTSRQEQAEWLAQAAALSRDGGVVRLMVVWNVDASIYNADPMAGWSIIRNGSCLACATLGATMGVGVPTATPSGPIPPQPGLKGEYFDNMDFTNLRVTRVDPVVDFSWDQGLPATGVGADTFSVRWTGQVEPQFSETYTFYTTSDDGVRLWVNGQLLINNWTDHAPTENSGTIQLNAGQRYDIRLEYYENTLGAQIQLRWSSPSQTKQIIPQNRLYSSAASVTPSPTPVSGNGAGLTGQYFDNRDFTSLRLTRVDPIVNFDWGNGSPDPQIGADTFSVRWSGRILPQYSETYTFYTTTDDGVRLWVNGQSIIDNWNDYPPTENRGTITLVAGQQVDIRLEYYENGGGASARLEWSSPSRSRQIVPASQLFPLTSSTATPSATATATLTRTATSTVTATQTPPPSNTPTNTPTATSTVSAGSGTGLTGEYYDNRDFTNLRLTRVDPVVNFNWDQNAPHPQISADTFSVRWTGRVIPTTSGTYTFYTLSDDGVRLWVGGQLIIDNWTDHAPTENSGTVMLTAGQPADIRLDYYENTLGAVIQLQWMPPGQSKQVIPQAQLSPGSVEPMPTATPGPGGSGTGLTGQYFDNLDFTNLRVTRVDPRIDFNWGRNAPVSGIDADTFSVRWSGQVEPLYTETYTFTTYADDGTRLWVNGQLIIDDWMDHSAIERTGSIALEAGRRYDIRLEYYDNGQDAIARLSWASARQPKQVIPQSQLYPLSAPPVVSGLLGEYFNTENLTQPVFTRTDSTVNFDWGSGAPRSDMGPETFSARWTGQVVPLYSETYTFYTVSDDGVRLWVNGQLIINNWTIHSPFEDFGTITLQAGQAYDLRLEYFENGGEALIRLLWSSPRQSKQIVPASQLRAPRAFAASLALNEAADVGAEGAAPSGDILVEPTATLDNMSLSLQQGGPEVQATAGVTEVNPQEMVVLPVEDQALAILTEVPSATPTLLLGERAASVPLCEAASEQDGAVTFNDQTVLGTEASLSVAALRFCGVAVPPGAVVISAWVELTPVETTDTTTFVELTLENSGNSETLASGWLPSQRSALAFLQWQPSLWISGVRVRTPELVPLIAEVVARPDWASGNALTVLAYGREVSGVRNIWSRMADASLVIRYLEPPTQASEIESTMPATTDEGLSFSTESEHLLENRLTEAPADPIGDLPANPIPLVPEPVEATAEATSEVS